MSDPSEAKTQAPPEKPKTALYASDDDPVVLRPHVYDGIQEYDQKLPNWWLFTFYIMIVAFVVWWIAYYQFDLFRSPQERVDTTMAVVNEQRMKELEALLADLDDKSLVTEWATNPVVLANAQATYTQYCESCHAEDLSAVFQGFEKARPLTDGVWEYGGRPLEIFELIRKGSPPEAPPYAGAKMEPWGLKLSSKEIAELTAFIISKNKAEFAPFAE